MLRIVCIDYLLCFVLNSLYSGFGCFMFELLGFRVKCCDSLFVVFLFLVTWCFALGSLFELCADELFAMPYGCWFWYFFVST